jgi:glycosyltransferase involved in cell wall biosynthesis
MSRLSVLLATEDSYPFHRGDEGAWCDRLTSALPDVDFTLLSITEHPYLAPAYDFTPNVRALITVPLDGMKDPADYGNHASFPAYLRRLALPSDEVRDYAEHYGDFLRQVVTPTVPARAVALSLLHMHHHLRYYDYRTTHAHPFVWDAYADVVRTGWRAAYPLEPTPEFADLVEGWRLLSRLLLPLGVEVSGVDLTHSVSAGCCGLPCVMAKLRQRIPYLLSERALYVREQYLTLTAHASPFVRWLLFRLLNTMVDVNYAYADQLTPSSRFNADWEIRRDVPRTRIRVIHDGVDAERFTPRRAANQSPPTVVSIGDVHPVNGQLDLVEAAALVRRDVPGAVFRFYGDRADESYWRQCHDLVNGLDLQDSVTFEQLPADTTPVLCESDVVAFARVTAAIPRVLLETMMTGGSIVATDIGGMREAIGDTGMLVPCGDPVAMAQSIAALLRSPDSRRRLGEAAHERATEMFSTDRFVDAYRSTYGSLVAPIPKDTEPAYPERETTYTRAIA